jgi:quercetin dioxygenase-like cupin family protein
MAEKSFQLFELSNECLSTSCDSSFPTALFTFRQQKSAFSADGTHFGYVFKGEANLQTNLGDFRLKEKMFFCVPDTFSIAGGAGIVITRKGYKGMFTIGGQIEEKGRLRYIDGCRDTLLIPPILKGDACLNALYFPPNIRQTPHTHPSVRVGIVASGHGECVTSDGTFQLVSGKAFIIAPEALHSFNTNDEEMVVIAYHPDSDFGATHEVHPMVNKTMVGGVSASKLDAIRTKDD